MCPLRRSAWEYEERGLSEVTGPWWFTCKWFVGCGSVCVPVTLLEMAAVLQRERSALCLYTAASPERVSAPRQRWGKPEMEQDAL